MPIYAYRCEECGLTRDVLQKVSDPQLTDCPSCGKPSFKKQLTAAGIGGAGWSANPSMNHGPCSSGGCMGGPCGFGN